MIWNKHFRLEGQHAFLSASKYHWVNYDEEKMVRSFYTREASIRGTREHALAAELIAMRVRLEDIPKTLNMYVNECIGWQMKPEQVLFFSENCFGTPDAISYRRGVLRISDLKTGSVDTKVTQLEIYAALFCLEYGVTPLQIEIELRIYQNNDVQLYIGDPDTISHIMDKMKSFDALIEELREEELV